MHKSQFESRDAHSSLEVAVKQSGRRAERDVCCPQMIGKREAVTGVSLVRRAKQI